MLTSQSTGASGFFTVGWAPWPLAADTYNWRVKGPNAQTTPANSIPGYLAVTGTVTLPGTGTTQQEMGLQRAGDANNDNVVSAQDFTILKATFGKQSTDPGYDGRADFDNNTIVSAIDFNWLKTNFGQGGALPIGPQDPEGPQGPQGSEGPQGVDQPHNSSDASGASSASGASGPSAGSGNIAGSHQTNQLGRGAGSGSSKPSDTVNIDYSHRPSHITIYIGNLYEEELQTGAHRPYIVYYYLGGKMVGMRRVNQQGTDPADTSPLDGQFKVVGDQLGSTTLVVGVDHQGNTEVVHREYYKPYGEVAYEYKLWHQGQEHRNIPTTFGYTGQRLDKEESGLMYYGARYYDPALSFFVSADSKVPDPTKSHDLNRYLYVRGNPLRYIDTSGYSPEDYYIFVNGCAVTNCEGDRPDWGEYTSLLHELYSGWRASYHRLGEDDALPSWETWSHEHLLFAHATLGSQGALELESKISGIKGNGHIHILGHSTGGPAIMAYFYYKMQADNPVSRFLGAGQLDPRITDVTIIDAPLGPEIPSPWDMGNWLKGKGIETTIIDTPNDWIVGGQLPDVPYVGDPDYTRDRFGNGRTKDVPPVAPNGPLDYGLASSWHSYTFRHVAVETGILLRRVWR